jgi:hypothetical protein
MWQNVAFFMSREGGAWDVGEIMDVVDVVASGARKSNGG